MAADALVGHVVVHLQAHGVGYHQRDRRLLRHLDDAIDEGGGFINLRRFVDHRHGRCPWQQQLHGGEEVVARPRQHLSARD